MGFVWLPIDPLAAHKITVGMAFEQIEDAFVVINALTDG
jgi:hypothetical protein